MNAREEALIRDAAARAALDADGGPACIRLQKGRGQDLVAVPGLASVSVERDRLRSHVATLETELAKALAKLARVQAQRQAWDQRARRQQKRAELWKHRAMSRTTKRKQAA